MNEKDERARAYDLAATQYRKDRQQACLTAHENNAFKTGFHAGYDAARASSPAVPSEAVEIAQRYLDNKILDTSAYQDLHQALRTLLDHVSRPTWVRVEDGLPEGVLVSVLACLKNEQIFRADYSNLSGRWFVAGLGEVEERNPVIAWIPLPSPFIADSKGDER